MGGIIGRILDLEWEMFQKTQNIGGRASCQDDRETFYRMRKSQWKVMSEVVLERYYADLCKARDQGRNMVAEKYGYMMENYDPQGFLEIQSLLPQKSKKEICLVEQIVRIHMDWYDEVQKQFPHVLSNGRNLRSSEDQIGDVSIETYLRGELKTYSEASLEACLHFLKECQKQGRNLVRENYQEMARAYGYESLERAEKYMGENNSKYMDMIEKRIAEE